MSGSETDKVKRYVVTHAYWDPLHKVNEFAYVLASDHDAALSAAQGEITRLREALTIIKHRAIPHGRTDELIGLIRSIERAASQALSPPSQQEIQR